MQRKHTVGTYLYLSVKQSLNINMLLADKYKNMSLPSTM